MTGVSGRHNLLSVDGSSPGPTGRSFPQGYVTRGMLVLRRELVV